MEVVLLRLLVGAVTLVTTSALLDMTQVNSTNTDKLGSACGPEISYAGECPNYYGCHQDPAKCCLDFCSTDPACCQGPALPGATPVITTYRNIRDRDDQLLVKGLATSGPSTKCYFFTLGTSDKIQGEDASTYSSVFIRDMVANGFCAAKVEYPDSSLPEYLILTNAKLEDKARGIYDPTYADSAIRSFERASNGACKCEEVIAHGFSQGAHIALLSRNFNSNVRGILMFSGGCQAGNGVIPGLGRDNCDVLKKTHTMIPRSRLRDISAQFDGVLGCEGWGPRAARKSLHQVKITTGWNCDGPQRCDSGHDFEQCSTCCAVPEPCADACTCAEFNNNCIDAATGSGYYILKQADYQFSGSDGHGWFQYQGKLQKYAMTTTEPFNIKANLAWLRSTVDMPVLLEERAQDKWTEDKV